MILTINLHQKKGLIYRYTVLKGELKMNAEEKKFIIKSDRLGFRLIHEDDFENYFKLDSNPEVRKFFPQGPLDANQVKDNMNKNIAFFKRNALGIFIVIELATGNFVGRAGFGEVDTGEIEVGYVFLPQFWGKGLATEALATLLQWAKQHIHSVDEIIAYAPIKHLASQNVMKKAGMTFYKNDTKFNTECAFYKIILRE